MKILENPTRESNSRIQLENPTRKSNSEILTLLLVYLVYQQTQETIRLSLTFSNASFVISTNSSLITSTNKIFVTSFSS